MIDTPMMRDQYRLLMNQARCFGLQSQDFNGRCRAFLSDEGLEPTPWNWVRAGTAVVEDYLQALRTDSDHDSNSRGP